MKFISLLKNRFTIIKYFIFWKILFLKKIIQKECISITEMLPRVLLLHLLDKKNCIINNLKFVLLFKSLLVRKNIGKNNVWILKNKWIGIRFPAMEFSIICGNCLLKYCQAQFKFSPSSVQFEMRLALILVITPTHPHPPIPGESRFEPLLDS